MEALFLLILTLLCPAAQAAYDFPIPDPYYASITSAVLKSNEFDKSVAYEDIAVSPNPARDDTPYYSPGQNKVLLRYWSAPGQTGKAPLIFMIAGLGGTAGASYYNFLAYHFVKQGFRVITVPNPMNFTFALAASKSGYPGETKADAEDLYRLMQLGLARLQKYRPFAYSSVGLMGVSLGALEAAYVAELDSRERKFDFYRTLLINPPVDPLYSIGVIDQLAAKKDKVSADRQKAMGLMTIQFGLAELVQGRIDDPHYFDDFAKKLPLTLDEREYLIGSSLTDFLASLLFTTQQVRDLGIFKTPIATADPEPRLAEAKAFTFTDYIQKFLLPALSADAGKALTYDDILPLTDMKGVENFLRTDSRVMLFDNADDFIVNADQLSYMQSVLGSRMTLFPHGGHVGNVWYPDNLNAILAAFQPR